MRPSPQLGQALPSYLETLAEANHITPAALLSCIRQLGGCSTYLLHAPTPQTLQVVGALTGQSTELLLDTTLGRYDGLAYSLDGIDPAQTPVRRAATYRKAAAHGWVPSRSSQVCPRCLAENTAWMLLWHLPGSTICLRHGSHLLATCPGCARPFRSNRAAPLRAVGPSTRCGNPLGQGPRQQCQVELSDLSTTEAAPAELRRQERFEQALERHTVTSFLGELAPKQYLDLSTSLTVLLLHLAGQPGATAVQGWPEQLTAQTETRRRERGPRWGIAPPDDPALRSQALTAAENIIESTDLGTAVETFRPWYDLTPRTTDGVLGWLADRTRMTPEMTRLVMATHSPRRRLSAHLDAAGPLLPLFAIPQTIPGDLYRDHVAHLMGCSQETGRCFVSLALARGHRHIRTWEEAAEALCLPPAHGKDTARAVTQRQRGSAEALRDAVHAVGRRLDPCTAWRLREEHVRAEADRTELWLPAWRALYRPGMKDPSTPYAITWRWIHEAGALLDTSPAWRGTPTPRQKAAYRQFESGVDARTSTHGSDVPISTAPRPQGEA